MVHRSRLLSIVAILTISNAATSMAFVSGKVTDTQGNYVSGALLTFFKQDNPDRIYRAVTNSVGDYELDFTYFIFI